MLVSRVLAPNTVPRRTKTELSGIEALAGWMVNGKNRLKPRSQFDKGLFAEHSGARRALASTLVIIVLISVFSVLPAQAENLGPGGGTRIITGDEVVGPYRLLITASPEPAQVGTLTIVVRVNDASTGRRVDDATIQVELTEGTSGVRLTQAATHANAGNEIDYATHFVIDRAGTWSGLVRVAGAAGAAEVSFVQRVQPQRQVGVLIAAGIPFIVILGVLIGLWLVRLGRKQPAAQ